MVFILIAATIPQDVFADTTVSSSLQLIWDNDENPVIGGPINSNVTVLIGGVETDYYNLKFRLLKDNLPFKGEVSATITNPEGVTTNASIDDTVNEYNFADLRLYTMGTYKLKVTDSDGNMATGFILAEDSYPNMRVETKDSLVLNTFGSVTVKVTDLLGNPIVKGLVTIDGTAVGSGMQTYSTLNDGTFVFAMTPTQSGIVKIIYGNKVIGGIEVLPAAKNIRVTTTGTLYANAESTLTIKLEDSSGDPIQRKTVTVDGTEVNASPATQTYTTLNDGTFIVKITPLLQGNVKVIYGGDVVGLIPVASQTVKFTYTGTLTVNSSKSITGKLTDPSGNPLQRKSGIADGAAVKATPATQAFTTLNDGTFVITMTPTQSGKVNIVLGGDVVGTIDVSPAFTWKYRIGSQAQDNVALSIEVVKQGWRSAENVILARDDQFSDAMSAVPLSKKLDAPILMTDSMSLDTRTLDEIRYLGAKNVYIVGGTLAISQGIQDSLKTEFTVTRIAGLQGYDTAAQISSYVGIDDTHTVYIANGYSIPDAIAISAFAAEQGSPILLIERDEIPASTNQALADLKVSNVVLLGGTACISPEVESLLRSKYFVKRWGGYDRYDTQSIIFQNLFNNSQTQTPQSPLYFTSGLVRKDEVSSGKPYADSLVTAALAAKNDGFVAMVTPNSIPSSLSFFIYNNIGYITKSAVVGNYSGVSQDVQLQLERILVR